MEGIGEVLIIVIIGLDLVICRPHALFIELGRLCKK
jgi:hypothetical protein